MSNAALRLDTYEQHTPQVSYRPRSPRNTGYHKLVADNYEELEGVWDSIYQRMYGYWRPHVLDVIYKYLDCGDPHLGFARVKCNDCNTEYLLPFSCKCRGFCPSCHQRRVVEFGEYLHDEVLEDVPHRQYVFTIPKRLRPYFMHNRKLLAKLSLCAWEVLSDYLKTSVSASVNDDNIKPAAAIAVQTFGELLNFNSHLHVIAADGCFNENGDFLLGISPNADDLTEPFANAVLKMLKKEKLINLAVINNMSTWQHSGFNVHCSSSVNFSDTEAIERLARYIVRAPISQERMKYIPEANSSDGEGKVIYEGKTTGRFETFSALDFLARLVTHIPNKYEQTVRYYGYYSNKSRGVRAKAEANDATVEISSESTNISSCSDHSATCPNQGDIAVAQPQTPAQAEDLTIKIPISLSRKRFKKNWSRLIQKIYNVDPLKCPNCGGKMRIIAFIEEETVIRKILKHLNKWLPQYHDPPDHLGNYNMPASLNVDTIPSLNETLENTQLNMFSERTYEWWESNNKLNSSITCQNVKSYTHQKDITSYLTEDEYQHPFEDEFSQEVFYED